MAVRKNSERLKPYGAAGLPTLLLIEWDDLALLNPLAVAQAFAVACPKVSANVIDDVVLVDSTTRPPWFYPVKRGPRTFPIPEFLGYFKAQFELGGGVV